MKNFLLLYSLVFVNSIQCALAERDNPPFFQALYEDPTNVERLESELQTLEKADPLLNINEHVDSEGHHPLTALLVAYVRDQRKIDRFPYETLDLLLRYGSDWNYVGPKDPVSFLHEPSFCEGLQELSDKAQKQDAKKTLATVIEVHNYTNNWIATHQIGEGIL